MAYPRSWREVLSWQSFFKAHASPFEGWDSDTNLIKWQRDGESSLVDFRKKSRLSQT
jgi:hypothetical protein